MIADGRRKVKTPFRRTPRLKIDVRVPSTGEPSPFAEMLAWCHANVAAGAWAQHGFMDKNRRDDRGILIDFARWYPMNEATAAAFDRQWLSGAAAAEIELQRDLAPVARTYSEAQEPAPPTWPRVLPPMPPSSSADG